MLVFVQAIPTPTNKHTADLHAAVTSAASAGVQPEFIPVPPKGPDRIFGLSRSWWYSLEADGLLCLVRLRRPGNVRGRVLIPVAQAREALAKLNNKEVVAA